MRPFECPSEDFRQCQELRKLYVQQVKALKAVRSPREMIYNISRMESRNTNRDAKRHCQRRLRTVKRRQEKIQGWREYKGGRVGSIVETKREGFSKMRKILNSDLV